MKPALPAQDPSPLPRPRRSRGASCSRGARRSPGAPRSRGVQSGNLNARSSSCALKHGFYSRQFKKTDLADLEACQFVGLNDEIAVLRVYLRRLTELGKDINTFPEMLGLVRVMCLASTSLTHLLKTQNLLHSPADERRKVLDEAIAETLSDLQAVYDTPSEPARGPQP